jgi:mannose-6-phosphate isomerase-like protein (cupin superfamily)
MQTIISNKDQVVRAQNPNYNDHNPVEKLLRLIEGVHWSAGIEYYRTEYVQYLFPFEDLVLYSPNQADLLPSELDFRNQDNKTDFQKQNIKDFISTDTYLVRGIVAAGGWIGPFLKISYRGGPDSKLSQTANHQLGDKIKLFLKIDENVTNELISAIYNPESDRYEVEIWGYPGNVHDLMQSLDDKGKAAIQRGELQLNPNLIKGTPADFKRENNDSQNMFNVAEENSLHPVKPLHIEAAWSDETGVFWDSLNGANYQYEFNMKFRGWENYLTVGSSSNPHGGLGSLEYRNLFSNYGQFATSNELSRKLLPWNLDAFGRKQDEQRSERFMAVDYVDLHILRPGCSIGIHRHRDNQEIFFMMDGTAFMVVGDWLKTDVRERCMEVRMMRPGDLVLLKNGDLHSLINTTDENISLLMFGGYD